MSRLSRSVRSTPNGRARHLFAKAQARARKTGVEFTIKVSDIEIPTRCPVLGIPICLEPDAPLTNRPSLDRTDNSRGYVPGNVAVVSFKANSHKGNLSIHDVRGLLAYLEAGALTA